jgi:DNA-binding transcriptional ArsR family regulator
VLGSEITNLPDVVDRLTALASEIKARVDRMEDATARPIVSTPVDLHALARQIYRGRRDRDRVFGNTLFADPTWDMLLDLYANIGEKRRISVSSLCLASAVPATTALRHITILLEAGLVERSASETDNRLRFVSLTELGISRMELVMGKYINKAGTYR